MLVADSSSTVMRSYRVLIIGSCITRDVFRAYGEGVGISDYYARTSIPSLVSTPLTYDPSSIKLPSEFQKRMIMRDFDKSLWQRIERKDYDLVLMDLIDERFPILCSGDVTITKSNELVSSGYLNVRIHDFIEYSKSEYGKCRWSVDCGRFAEGLLKTIPIEKIVIIKAFWASKYQNKDGLVKDFDATTKFSQEYISRSNLMLKGLYKEMEFVFHGCEIIDLPEPLADERHIWGLSPFHYENKWYRACRDRLDRIMSHMNEKETGPHIQ